jgi:hypothetical protein
MKSIYQEERQKAIQLRKQIKDLILKEVTTGMNPCWFISFHYTDNKTNEDEILRDVADLKNTFGLTEPDFDLMLSREKR